MDWWNIMALACVIAGFINGVTGLKSMRSKTHPQAEIAWKQSPLSAWHYETLNMIAITIHSLGSISLTGLLLTELGHNRLLSVYPISRFTSVSDFLVLMIAVFGLSMAAYICGTMIAFHFAQQWIKPVSYGICANGMLYGGQLFSWKSYSRYEVGPNDGLIYLYSSYSPSIRSWVIAPPPESFASALALIQKNLPAAQPIADSQTWQHSPLTLILAMAFLVLGTLLPAVWSWTQDQSWVWGYTIAAFFFVLIFGNNLITFFDGRGKYPSKQVQTG